MGTPRCLTRPKLLSRLLHPSLRPLHRLRRVDMAREADAAYEKVRAEFAPRSRESALGAYGG